MDNTLIVLYILIVFLLVCVFAIFIYLLKNSKKDNTSKDFLNFSKQLNKDINDFKDNTTNRLIDIEDRLNSNILKTSEITNNTFNSINERLIKIDENQKSLDDLKNNITSLQSVLSDKKARGTFGEVELYSILESAFGIDENRYSRQYVLENGTRVDAVVFGSESLGLICIDSKFPLENYRKIYEDGSDKEKAKKDFKNDVLKHINDISSKYIIAGVTAPMAYMFVPSEAIFSEIYGNFPEVIDKAYKSQVYIVSPTTLMAYLTAIRSIYLGQKKNEKAKEIEKLLSDLSIEFIRLKERSETLQRDFEKIVPDFEKMFVTENKIIKRFSAIEKGEIDD